MGTSSQGFDLMDDDMEDETSNELETVEECDDSGGNKQMVEFPGELAGKEKPQEPYVGLEFKSADDAREHYSEYARLNGFTVRVNRKRRSRIDRAVIGFDYVCSKEGFRRKKGSMEEKILRLSKQTRVGCKAILVIAYRRDIEKWVVTNFIKEHNHELMVPSEVPVRQIDKGPLNEDDKDKKIRELTTKLYNEKQRFQRQCAAYEERCAEYKAQLGKILKDIELHTEHLTNKVQDVVQSIKEIEDEEDSDQDHYQPPAILMYVDSFVGNDAEMIENTTGRDLCDSQIIETSIIDRVPARGGEDSGEMTENSNEMGLNSSYADEDLDPHEGMEFESEETAKAFYDAYAMHVGFVTRMSSYCRLKIDGAVISRRLVCNKEGFKKREIKRPMAVTREGCKVMINIKRQKPGKFLPKKKPGKWIISKFQKEHNYPLLISSKIQRGSLQNRSMEDARKIRELSYALQRANRRCTVYREQLDMGLKDIEKHTDHLPVKVQEIVNSITEIESEEDHSHHDRQLC